MARPRPASMYFTPGHVWKVFKKLPNRRALGSGGIQKNLLKHCGRKTITHICQIFNWCASFEHFPSSWKCAFIIMLPEPGKDNLNTYDHRQIFLLSTMAKLFEKFSKKKVSKRCPKNNNQKHFNKMITFYQVLRSCHRLRPYLFQTRQANYKQGQNRKTLTHTVDQKT